MRTIVYALVLFVLFTGISIEGSAAKRKKTKKVQKTENAYEKLFKGKQVHTSKGMMTDSCYGRECVLLNFRYLCSGKICC